MLHRFLTADGLLFEHELSLRGGSRRPSNPDGGRYLGTLFTLGHGEGELVFTTE